MPSEAQLRRAAPAAYLAALAVLGPFLTPQIGIWHATAEVGSLNWRFGFVGLIYSSSFYLLLALLIGALTAGYFSHRRALGVLGIVGIAAAVLLLAALPLFALDTLQLRKTLNPGVFLSYKEAALKGAALGALAVPVFLVFSYGVLKALRSLPASRGAGDRQAPAPLIR